jgi:hypothetical protein
LRKRDGRWRKRKRSSDVSKTHTRVSASHGYGTKPLSQHGAASEKAAGFAKEKQPDQASRTANSNRAQVQGYMG